MVRWLAQDRRGLWVCLLLALLIALPTFRIGLLHDDLLHRARLLLPPDVPTSPTTLYEFVPNEVVAAQKARGWMPWWTGEDLHVTFFRPLPSLLIYLDHQISPHGLWWMRLHSIGWFMLLVTVAWRLLRRLLASETANLACALMVLAGPLAMAVGWTAARYVLLVGVMGLASLHAHLRWQEEGKLRHLAAGVGLLALGLLTGELALGTVGLVAAYQLLGRRDAPLRQRLLRLAPWLGLALMYLLWYGTAGFGARGTWAYTDPRHAPLAYLGAVAEGVPILLADALLKVPSALAGVAPEAKPTQIVLGVLVSLALVVTVWRHRAELDPADRPNLGWLLAGGVLTLVPASAGVLGGRLLVLALPGVMGLVAVVLRLCWRKRDALAEQGLGGRWRWAIAFWVLLIISGPVGALGWLNLTNMLALASETQWRVAREAPGLCAGDNVLLHGSDPTVTVYTLPARVLQGEPEPRSWNVLMMAPQDVQVKRTGPAALTLRVVGPRRHNWWERVQRDTPWQAGETHRLAALQVTIVEADERGPVAIAVDFNEPLEAPDFCFSHWHDGTLMPWKPPAIGETVTLPYERGPMELQ